MSPSQPLQDLPGERAGDVDPGIGGRDVGHVDVEPPLGVPAQHRAVERVDARGGGGDVEPVLGEAAGDAVVDDRTGHVAGEQVAGAADRLPGVGEGVDPLQQLGGVGAAHLEPAQRADVDHADARPHGTDLGGDRGLARGRAWP